MGRSRQHGRPHLGLGREISEGLGDRQVGGGQPLLLPLADCPLPQSLGEGMDD